MKRLKYWVFWIVSLLFSISFWYCYDLMCVNIYDSNSVLLDTVCSDTIDNTYNVNIYRWDWISLNTVDNYPDWVDYYFTNSISINTWEILSWYILESEIDNLYCENHWYCPIIDTWDTENQWSALYINDIQHIGAWLINLTIPEEFERDYIYTWNWEELDIDVKWYNVDTAYIDWLITTQRTLPNNTDFNNTISWLLPLFVPWIVIIFFLYFIFRFIKKVF